MNADFQRLSDMFLGSGLHDDGNKQPTHTRTRTHIVSCARVSIWFRWASVVAGAQRYRAKGRGKNQNKRGMDFIINAMTI